MITFLEEVAHDLTLKLGNHLQESILVFPGKRPMLYLEKFLLPQTDMPFWAPSMFTIQEFFALSSELKVADFNMQFFTLWKSYQDLLEEGERQNLVIDRFYKIGTTILSDFLHLDENLVPIQQIFHELKDLASLDQQFGDLDQEQKAFLQQFWNSFSPNQYNSQQEIFIKIWRRMPLLYESFHARLKANGLSTQGNIYRNFAEKINEKKGEEVEFLKKFQNNPSKGIDFEGKIVFIGFNALNKAEKIIMKHLHEVGKALFYFDLDTSYLNDPIHEAGKFLRYNLNTLGLVNSLPASMKNKDLEDLNKPKRLVNIYPVQGQTVQAKILPSLLNLEWDCLKVKENTNKIAIVLADESLLIPVLQSIPTHYPEESIPIPINITMGYSMSSSPLFGLLGLWLEIQKEISQLGKHALNFTLFETYIHHPLIPITNPKKEFLLNRILEEQKEEVLLVDMATLIPNSQFFFKKHSTGINFIESCIQMVDWILQSSIGNNIEAPEDDFSPLDLELAGTLLKELNTFLEGITEFESQITIPLALALIKKVIRSVSIPLAGEPLEGLQIMGLLETRSLDFETIYLLGASETFLPKKGNAESLLPDSLLRAYGLPTTEDLEALYAYEFYRLFHRSKNISIMYNSIQDERNSGEPSRYIRQILFERDFNFKDLVYSPNFLSQKTKPITVKKEGNLGEKLKDYYVIDGSAKRYLSATALNYYLTCPLQFFYRYILELKEPEMIEENLEANTLGTLLHLVMQLFYEDLVVRDAPITKEIITDYRKKIPSFILNAYYSTKFPKKEIAIFQKEISTEFKEETYNHNADSSFYNDERIKGKDKIVLTILEEWVNRILDYDETKTPFTLHCLEHTIQSFIQIEVEKLEQFIGLKGTLDRIHSSEGILKIIDYKTGKEELKFNSIPQLFEKETKRPNKALVQALFYAFLVDKEFSKDLINENVKVVNPSLKENEPNGELKFNESEPNLYIVQKMNDPAFESRLMKGQRQYTPLKSFMLEEAKGEFLNELKIALEELFNLEIPFMQTKNRKACEYCNFKNLCGR